MLKTKHPYLKGKSVFIISLLVITITALTVYFTGIEYNRTISTNFYYSLTAIGFALLLFLTYGLFFGIGLHDNFPKLKPFKVGNLSPMDFDFSAPSVDADDIISGILLSIVYWIVMTIAIFLILLLLEAVFWVSIFIIPAMLYWVFFRAMKLVFSKSKNTVGNLENSMIIALKYTTMYIGWIFGLVYLSEILR